MTNWHVYIKSTNHTYMYVYITNWCDKMYLTFNKIYANKYSIYISPN